MQWKVSMIALIGLSVLCVTGCGTMRRTAVSRSEELRTTELRSTEARDSVVVELRDTLVETTTITIDRNEVGDTLKVVQVTDRTRAASRDRVREAKEKVVVKTDTVYVERRNSVSVESRNYESTETRKSNFVTSLKWVFWIVVALMGLVVVVRVSRFKFHV